MFKKAVLLLFLTVPAFAGGVKNLNIMAEEAIVDYFSARNLEVLSVTESRFDSSGRTVIESQVAVVDRVHDLEYSYVCKNHFVSGFVSWVITKTECVEK